MEHYNNNNFWVCLTSTKGKKAVMLLIVLFSFEQVISKSQTVLNYNIFICVYFQGSK